MINSNILVTVAILAVVPAIPVRAQAPVPDVLSFHPSAAGKETTTRPCTAPVGHRQPRAIDVPSSASGSQYLFQTRGFERRPQDQRHLPRLLNTRLHDFARSGISRTGLKSFHQSTARDAQALGSVEEFNHHRLQFFQCRCDSGRAVFARQSRTSLAGGLTVKAIVPKQSRRSPRLSAGPLPSRNSSCGRAR